jgi:Kef-type K+ transport system membrane component KefB
MSATTQSTPTKTSVLSPAVTAAFGFVVYVLAIIAGEVFEVNADHRLPHHQDQSLWEVLTGFWAEFAIALVGIAVAVWAGRRALSSTPSRVAPTALILAAIGVITIVAFWSGWPNVLGAVAVGLALDSRQRLGSLGPMAVTAAVLGTLAFVAGSVLCMLG